MVVRTLHKLVNSFQAIKGQRAVDVTEWISYFGFDTMGELAFNKSFDMLDKHEWSGAAKVLRYGTGILAYVSPAPWLAHITFAFVPKSMLLWQALVNLAKEMMGDRLAKDSARKDVSNWMIEAERQWDKDLNMMNLYGDAFAVSIAGRYEVIHSCLTTC